MGERMPIMLGDDAIEKFVEFCRRSEFSKYYIVADENTAAVLGDRVYEAVNKNGWDVIYHVLNPEGLHTDGTSITRVLDVYDAVPRLFVAVGSGTITDTTRITSYKSQNKFVSFPTAASVDAYTGKNAAVTIGNLKKSVYCDAPIAIFTDLPTICTSPKFLTASGFGDLISKQISTADWKMSHLIWETDFDEDIYARALNAGQRVVEEVDGIRAGDPGSMAAMMEAQFESGFCMADFGNSAPASGSGHHMAHIWEMMFHWEEKEGLFHGDAVGVAAIMSAKWYQRMKAMSRTEVESLLDSTAIPSRDTQIAAIRVNLPIIADELIESDPIYLQISEAAVFGRVRSRILEHWEILQETAKNVPDPEAMRGWIKILGGKTTAEEIGVSRKQAEIAREYGLYLRERFSINILRKLLGW